MAQTNSFVEHVVDQLSSLGPVRARAMFGGFGIFRGAQCFGLIVDDRLYFKTDAQNRAEFEQAGGVPFTFGSKKGPMETGYLTPPDDALDDADALSKWGRLGLEAADRKGAKKATTEKKATTKEATAKKATAKKATPARKPIAKKSSPAGKKKLPARR